MTGYARTQGNSVCWFTDGTITTGSGNLVRKYLMGEHILAGVSSTTIGATALAAITGLVAIFRVAKWRDARGAEVVEGELDLLEEAD